MESLSRVERPLLNSNRQHKPSGRSRFRAKTRLGRQASRKARTRSELNRLRTQTKYPRRAHGKAISRKPVNRRGKGAKQKSKHKEKSRLLKGARIDSRALPRIGSESHCFQ